MATAKDPMQYQAAADALIGLNQAAIDRGLKGVQPIDPQSIPPFMTEADKAALATQQKAADDAQRALTEAQSAPMGMWDRMRSGLGFNQDSTIMGIPMTFDKERAVNAAQQKYDMEQKALGAMKGSSPGFQKDSGGFFATEASEAAHAGKGPNYPTQTAPAATGATGGSMPTISSQEASAKTGKPVSPGTILIDKNGNRILVN